MAFEFLSSLDTTTLFLLLIIFILFVLSMKKIFSIIMNAVWIAVASVLFPVVMNRFFGFEIPITTDSVLSFILLGLGVYFIYLLGKSIYKILNMGEKAIKKSIPHREKSKKKDEKEHKEDKEREMPKKDYAKEQQARWHATDKNKPHKNNWQKDYAEIKEPAASLPSIKKKKKKL